jgi:2,3-dihydroxybenzoate decarboxylase
MMDKAGIELSVLSQTSPGLQGEKDAKVAARKQIEGNDFLFAEVSKNPKRYAGFAHLAMHEPKTAIAELTRCVKELGFVGAMINGQTNGVYLDEDQYIPFWEAAVDLDVPIYIHPGNPYQTPYVFKDYPAMEGAFWGWGTETASHAIRIVLSGLFDRLPKLKIILGHMGETLPFTLWRFDSRWPGTIQSKKLQKPPSHYIKENIIITISGVFDAPPLLCSMASIGVDNILFSTDYPYEDPLVAAEFIDKVKVSEEDRAKICYKNAERVLKIRSTVNV